MRASVVQNGPLQTICECTQTMQRSCPHPLSTYFVHSETNNMLCLLTSSSCNVLPGQQCFLSNECYSCALLNMILEAHDARGVCMGHCIDQDTQDVFVAT